VGLGVVLGWFVRIGVAVALGLVLAQAALAQDFFGEGLEDGERPFDITADSIDTDAVRGIYTARGNVRIIQPTRVLRADLIVFSAITRQGVATGNVLVIDGEDTLNADVLQFQIDTLEGVVFGGEVGGPTSKFTMTGDVIRKVGDQRYIIDDAEFTSCRCPEEGRQPWKLTASKADLELGAYGKARNAAFEILGVPVLWFPWMIYPLNSDRQTGFLFPEWNASSREGTDIGLPFFWAVNDRVNMLFKLAYLTENGIQFTVASDYVFGEKSEGRLVAQYIDDTSIDPENPSSPFSSQRWAAEWVHDQYLPKDWRWVVDARAFSDNRYPFDFRDFQYYRDFRYIESTTFVEKRFGSWDQYGFFTAVKWADDIQNPDDQDRDEFLLQRAPQIHLSGLNQAPIEQASNLKVSFDTDYSYFYTRKTGAERFGPRQLVDGVFVDTGIEAIPDGEERDEFGNVVSADGTEVTLQNGDVITAAEYMLALPPGSVVSPDGSMDNFAPGPENDGVFEEGEPLAAGGHRLTLNPRLAYPMRIADLVEVYPEIGWQGTLYDTEILGSEMRNLFTAQLDLRTRLRRVLELPFGMGDATHLVEPRFNFTAVSDQSQEDNPLFTPQPFVIQQRLRQLELMNVTRDSADRIPEALAVTIGVGQRMYTEKLGGEGTSLFADIDTSLQYDFADRGLTGFFIDGILYPGYGIRTRFSVGYDFVRNELGEVLLATGWSHPDGHDIGFGYRYVANIPRFYEDFTFDDDRFVDFEEGFGKVNQINVFARGAITRNWAIIYSLQYSFEGSFVLTNRGGVEYISRCKCWAVRVEVGTDRTRGTEFSFRYTLLGLGDDTVRPFSNQGRNQRRQDSFGQPGSSYNP